MLKLTSPLLAILLFFNGCSGTILTMTNRDMFPLIKPGDKVIADTDYYSHHKVKRFDIVVVIDPEGNKTRDGKTMMYVKRVLAFGGEVFAIKDRKYYVNGQELDLPFAANSPEMPEDYGPLNVVDGEYFVMGDSFGPGLDSRYWRKPVLKKDGIYGKVTAVKDNATGVTRKL